MSAIIKQTPQQRANTIDALENMWPSVPPENVFPRLAGWVASETFNGKHTCNTVACFGGWCSAWPAFRAQGVKPDIQYGAMPQHSETGDPFRVGLVLFGDIDIFEMRYYHPADDGFTGTDHELVTNRLRWLLANSEVVE